jgi:cytochrome c-type biogenesis protein CcmH/NrfG
MLRRLARQAAPSSEDFVFAHRNLAELLVETSPWIAALSARQVIAYRPDDDGAWALRGLACTILGHYRTAVASYRRALTIDPGNPSYAHNLGHLLDVALGRPADSLYWLSIAAKKQAGEAEIAASYAHALGRCKRVSEAIAVLGPHIRRGANAEQKALLEWLNAGAPSVRPPAPDKASLASPSKKKKRKKAAT